MIGLIFKIIGAIFVLIGIILSIFVVPSITAEIIVSLGQQPSLKKRVKGFFTLFLVVVGLLMFGLDFLQTAIFMILVVIILIWVADIKLLIRGALSFRDAIIIIFFQVILTIIGVLTIFKYAGYF